MTIVVPTHNRVGLLERMIASLGECEPPSGDCRLIVVENGGRFGADAVVPRAAAWLHGEYLNFESGNKSAALNRALEGVDAGLVVFFDDDIRLEPGTLVAYERAANQHASGAFFGGPTGVDCDAPPADWYRDYLPTCATGSSPLLPDVPPEKRQFLGFNWAAYADDLHAAGGFDPNFGPGSPTGSAGQETDMQARLLERGLLGILVPEAKVWHYVPAERCTPEWGLGRAYRSGVYFGLKAPPDAPRLFGHPRWLVRAIVEHELLHGLKRWFGSRRAAYATRVKAQNLRGQLEGARQARARDAGE